MMERHLIWDFDGTLAVRDGGWSGALAEVWVDHAPQHPISAEQFRPCLQRGFPWHQPEILRPAGESPQRWWQRLQPVFVQAFREVARTDDATASTLARRVRQVYADGRRWRLLRGVEQALAKLTGLGFDHVILSNHTPELPQIVRGVGIAGSFKALFNSAVTGVEKPHPQAFRQVLETLPGEAEVWMIGDSMTSDVAGAEAVGIPAILVHREEPAAVRCCHCLSELPSMLEAAVR